MFRKPEGIGTCPLNAGFFRSRQSYPDQHRIALSGTGADAADAQAAAAPSQFVGEPHEDARPGGPWISHPLPEKIPFLNYPVYKKLDPKLR